MGRPVPALPSRPAEPLRAPFAALLPERPLYHPDHSLGCHRLSISDRIIFDKLLQLLRFGCSYEAIADTTCSATTIRNRRDQGIALGGFARLRQVAWESYDRIVGLVLGRIAIDGSITKGPGGGEAAGHSPVDRGRQGLRCQPPRFPAARPAPGPPGRPRAVARRHHRVSGHRQRLGQDVFYRLARCYERRACALWCGRRPRSPRRPSRWSWPRPAEVDDRPEGACLRAAPSVVAARSAGVRRFLRLSGSGRF